MILRNMIHKKVRKLEIARISSTPSIFQKPKSRGTRLAFFLRTSNRSLSRLVKLLLVWQTISRVCRCIRSQTDKESIELRTKKRREKRIEKGSLLLFFTLSHLPFRRGASLDIFCLGVGEAEASQGRVRHHCEFQLVTEQLAHGGDKIRFRLELS